MKKTILLCVVSVIAGLGCRHVQGNVTTPWDVYCEAIESGHSTASSYLVAVIVNRNTGETNLVSMDGRSFLYALQNEYNITSTNVFLTPQEYAKIDRIAYSATNRVFVFSKEKALRWIPEPVDEEDLEVLRRIFSKYSDKEILVEERFREIIYKEVPDEYFDDRAIAQVLFERGLSYWIGCVDGNMHIGRPSPKELKATGEPAP